MGRRRRGMSSADALLMQAIIQSMTQGAVDQSNTERTGMELGGLKEREAMSQAGQTDRQRMADASAERRTGMEVEGLIGQQRIASQGLLDVEKQRGENALKAEAANLATQSALKSQDFNLARRKEMYDDYVRAIDLTDDEAAGNLAATTYLNNTAGYEEGIREALSLTFDGIHAAQGKRIDTQTAQNVARAGGVDIPSAMTRGDATTQPAQPTSALEQPTPGTIPMENLTNAIGNISKNIDIRNKTMNAKLQSIEAFLPLDKLTEALRTSVGTTPFSMGNIVGIDTRTPAEADKIAAASLSAILRTLPDNIVPKDAVELAISTINDPDTEIDQTRLEAILKSQGGAPAVCALARYVGKASILLRNQSAGVGDLERPMEFTPTDTPSFEFSMPTEAAHNAGLFLGKLENRLDSISDHFAKRTEGMTFVRDLVGQVDANGRPVNPQAMGDIIYGLYQQSPSMRKMFLDRMSSAQVSLGGKPLTDAERASFESKLSAGTWVQPPHIDALYAETMNKEAMGLIAESRQMRAQQAANIRDEEADISNYLGLYKLGKRLKIMEAGATGDPAFQAELTGVKNEWIGMMKEHGFKPDQLDQMPGMLRGGMRDLLKVSAEFDATMHKKAMAGQERSKSILTEKLADLQANQLWQQQQAQAQQAQQQQSVSKPKTSGPAPVAAPAPMGPMPMSPPMTPMKGDFSPPQTGREFSGVSGTGPTNYGGM